MRKIVLGIMMCLMLITGAGLVGCGITPPPSGIITPSDPGETIPENPITPENPNTPETPIEPETPTEPEEPETPVVPEKTLSDEILEEIETLLYDQAQVSTKIEVESSTKNQAKLLLNLEDFVNEETGYIEEDLDWILETIFGELEGLSYTYEISGEKIELSIQKTELN